MCDCWIRCGFDHCCMHECYDAYKAMPASERPKFWTDTPCPKPHPPEVVTKARSGDQAAAASVIATLKESGTSSWNGVTLEEMQELAAGDTEAVEARRRWKASVRAEYARNRARYIRWSLELHIQLAPGQTLSSREEFPTLARAIERGEEFAAGPEALRKLLRKLNAKGASRYVEGPDTHVLSVRVVRERLTYPWYWIGGHKVWWPEIREWEWRSEDYKALVAETDARYEAQKAAGR